jgi:hypothetical protein
MGAEIRTFQQLLVHLLDMANSPYEPDRLVNVGSFSEGQRRFLDYHGENVLRMARRSG